MRTIELHTSQRSVPLKNAPAGSICEILDAEDEDMIGMLCIRSFSTNQATIILNYNQASTDLTSGIKKVRPLQKGESFTVTI